MKKSLTILLGMILISVLLMACVVQAPPPAAQPQQEAQPAEAAPTEAEAAPAEEPAAEAEAKPTPVTPSYAVDASKAPYEVVFDWGTFKLADYIVQHLEEGQTLKIQDSWRDPAEPGWGPVLQDAANAAAEEFGFEYEMVGPVSGEVAEQASMLDDLIVNQTADCLVVAQQTADLFNPLIDKAMEAGIPVFSYNIDAPDSKRIAHYGQNLPESGRSAAREFLKYHPKEGKVALFGGNLASDYVIDRLAGFREVIEAEAPDIEFLGPYESGYDRGKVYSMVEDVYTANPDMTGMYFAEHMSIAGAEFVERNGLQDEVTVVGFNIFPEMMSLIESGAMDSTVGQFIYSQGYEPSRMCYEFLTQGKLPEVEFVDLGGEVVDKTNYQEYQR